MRSDPWCEGGRGGCRVLREQGGGAVVGVRPPSIREWREGGLGGTPYLRSFFFVPPKPWDNFSGAQRRPRVSHTTYPSPFSPPLIYRSTIPPLHASPFACFCSGVIPPPLPCGFFADPAFFPSRAWGKMLGIFFFFSDCCFDFGFPPNGYNI